MIAYIERCKDIFGVEPICTTLTSADVPIAPSTFYAARTRPPSARAARDEDVKPVIARVHRENYGVYGIRRMHARLNRERVLAGRRAVVRCTTARLMKDLGLRGISRSKGPRTTIAGKGPDSREPPAGGGHQLTRRGSASHQRLLDDVLSGDRVRIGEELDRYGSRRYFHKSLRVIRA